MAVKASPKASKPVARNANLDQRLNPWLRSWAKRQTQRQLCQNLEDFGIGFVMSGPSRSAKAMAWFSPNDSGRRGSAFYALGYDQSRALNMFALRD